jgi:hypothetical protein
MPQDDSTSWDSPLPRLDVDAFAQVASTFINFCDAFNKQDSTKIGSLLTDNAILYRIKSGTAIRGKPDVLKYLQGKFDTEKPTCSPVTTALHPPNLPTSVRGVALWGSAATPSATYSIQYEVLFQPDAPNKITSMWARAS